MVFSNQEIVNVDSTGYGLFIVKGIVQAHGGKVWAESEGEGKGSEFWVEVEGK
ncbi:MAG: HAMP domain-containing histidine kinase [Patescibacteria group bacterium]|nr:HAMP domain-containing histidine kinase [Patescibacteria group bacterium]